MKRISLSKGKFEQRVIVWMCPWIDPFTSAEAGDESMPNLNPFLSNPVVDATQLPAVSSDGVSFSSRTSGHEMFGGNDSFCFSSKVLSHLFISPLSLIRMTSLHGVCAQC